MQFKDTSWWSWKFFWFILPKMLIGHALAFILAYALECSSYEFITIEEVDDGRALLR